MGNKAQARAYSAQAFARNAAVALGLWFVLCGTPSFPELAVGAGACLLAAASLLLVARSGLAGAFRPHAGWILAGWRVPGEVLSGTWVIVRSLFRQLAGHPSEALIRSVRFEPGGDDAPSETLRALIIAFTTLPPNFVAIDVDRRRRLLLVHQVARTQVPAVARRLGVRA